MARVEPALGDRLGPGEEVHALDAVGVGVAEEAVLPPTEGVVGHRRGDRHVDADHPDLDLVLEAPRCPTVVGEDRRAVAVGVVVDQLQALVVGAHPHDREHRAEDLVRVDRHLRRHPVEERRLEEEAPTQVAGTLAPVDDELRAGRDALLDVAGDLVQVRPGDERAHVGVAHAVTGAQGAGALGDLGDELVGDRVGREHDRDRHAPLPRSPVAGVDRGVGGQVEVGVGQDEHVVLRAAERLDPLAGGDPALVDVARDRRRPDEGDRLDVGVVEQRVDRLLVAVHDVDHAVRHSGLTPQVGDEVDRGRVLLARLDDDGVARRDGDGDEPQRHHGREVEGRDDRDDPERLEDRVGVDARRDVFGEATLEQLRDAAGELDDLLAARDLPLGVLVGLAVLGGDRLGDLVLPLLEQLTEGEERPHATGERDVAPLLRRRLGLGHDLVDGLGAGEVEGPGDLTGRGVVDLAGPAGLPLPRLVTDEVGDATGRGRAGAHLCPPLGNGDFVLTY